MEKMIREIWAEVAYKTNEEEKIELKILDNNGYLGYTRFEVENGMLGEINSIGDVLDVQISTLQLEALRGLVPKKLYNNALPYMVEFTLLHELGHVKQVKEKPDFIIKHQFDVNAASVVGYGNLALEADATNNAMRNLPNSSFGKHIFKLMEANQKCLGMLSPNEEDLNNLNLLCIKSLGYLLTPWRAK